MRIDTLFLDAGGVILFPNWTRMADALARHGVRVDPGAVAAADPRARRRLDVAPTIRRSTDRERGWLYFNLVLTEAGVPLSAETDAALAELHEYHSRYNLWELVPDEVVPALGRLRALGLRLAVISNANGTLRAHLARLGLDADLYHVDVTGARAAGLRAVLFDAADLYGDCDCPRVGSLDALVEWVTKNAGG